MGRYYNGDIEGKFMFAVQSSDDADFFGVAGFQPERLEYYYEKENIKDVEKGIEKCNKKLGAWKDMIDDFFDKNEYYNDETVKANGWDLESFRSMLVWYARLHLGEKILKCLKETDQCYFEAEL